jgi:hypothetical protein
LGGYLESKKQTVQTAEEWLKSKASQFRDFTPYLYGTTLNDAKLALVMARAEGKAESKCTCDAYIKAKENQMRAEEREKIGKSYFSPPEMLEAELKGFNRGKQETAKAIFEELEKLRIHKYTPIRKNWESGYTWSEPLWEIMDTEWKEVKARWVHK